MELESVNGQGLAGWLLAAWRSYTGARAVQVKRLALVETLDIGGRRQLALVRCGEEEFLVGSGAQGVTAIAKVGAEGGRCAS